MPEKSHGQRILSGYSSWDCKSWTQLSATKPPPPPGDIEGRRNMAPEAGPETKKAGKEHEVLEALEGLMLKLKLQ